MKKIKPLILAIIIGISLAFLVFNEVHKESVVSNTIALQIGVFNNKENAENLKNRLGGVVINDNGQYRVYYAILHDKRNIDFMTNILDEKNISYYLKSIDLEENAFLKSDRYENLMNKSTRDSSKLKINEEILKILKDVL